MLSMKKIILPFVQINNDDIDNKENVEMYKRGRKMFAAIFIG